ncbi:MFS DHA1 protein [Mycena indigotica]|uniref:MFS DHA1 protein n=1 Tax=Mycena indigotica TaxID=2126181 RepID=A0A8H6W6Q3_9AGAR|nr:MFS DHA1 protein [Mycena indigotica]KAF7303663.1 MFS DHA1 protein [Mycena indigotica]
MASDSQETQVGPQIEHSLTKSHRLDFGFLPIPRSCRPSVTGELPYFGYTKTIAFGTASTFSKYYICCVLHSSAYRTNNFPAVMNLYYNQPILLELAKAFRVDDEGVSKIPTLLQAGYASGLLLLSPLGDLIKRRPLILLLIATSGSLTIGLALTRSLIVFEVLCFLIAFASVLIPLAADLAPANRRATFMSIVFSGLLLGVLLARLLSGIIAQFSSYRNIFWMGAAAQYALLGVLYFITPSTPAKNPHLTYFAIMRSMAKFLITEPALIQGCLIFFCNSAIFSGFWVTLTFLLGGPPYNYSTIVIGLFALVGMVGICMAPVAGRVVDGMVPWTTSLVGMSLLVVSQILQTFAGQRTIAAVVISTILLDIGIQSTQVSMTATIFSMAPEARARLNALLILAIFIGQVAGTAIGTKLFVERGYEVSSGVRVAFGGASLLLLVMRGPHVRRSTWVGWEGGTDLRKPKEVVVEPKTNG